MSFQWYHWFVICRKHCGWFTQFFPPSQMWSKEMEREIKNMTCHDCGSPTNVRWVGEKEKS